MPLEFIYIMYAGFLIFARDVASNNGRRRLFKNLKRGRRSLARAGGSQETTRVVIHLLRSQTRLHTWLSWLRRFLLIDALPCHEFESHQGQFSILFPNLHYFLYFLFYLIFLHHFNSFPYFISALKNHQNNFFFLHYFHKMFI